MKKKLTKWQQEYIDSFHRLHKSPRYIDFEFYVIEFMYYIHYIAEKDKVYVVTVSIAPFLALMHAALRSALKKLAEKIQPKVYEYGFLTAE